MEHCQMASLPYNDELQLLVALSSSKTPCVWMMHSLFTSILRSANKGKQSYTTPGSQSLWHRRVTRKNEETQDSTCKTEPRRLSSRHTLGCGCEHSPVRGWVDVAPQPWGGLSHATVTHECQQTNIVLCQKMQSPQIQDKTVQNK